MSDQALAPRTRVRLSTLPIVNRAVGVLRETERLIAEAETGRIKIYIAGDPQDEALAAACKASVLAELKGRKASLERDLASYGVELP